MKLFRHFIVMYKCPSCSNEQEAAGKCSKCGAEVVEAKKPEEVKEEAKV